MEEKETQQPTIIIQNTNNVIAGHLGKAKNKWIAFILWLLLGLVGGHKFYEEKIGTGIIYLFTFGIFGLGWVIDFFSILNKPTVYYV